MLLARPLCIVMLDPIADRECNRNKGRFRYAKPTSFLRRLYQEIRVEYIREIVDYISVWGRYTQRGNNMQYGLNPFTLYLAVRLVTRSYSVDNYGYICTPMSSTEQITTKNFIFRADRSRKHNDNRRNPRSYLPLLRFHYRASLFVTSGNLPL